MVCEFIITYNKHLGFFGVLISAIAAMLLVYTARELLGFTLQYTNNFTEKNLLAIADKLAKIDKKYKSISDLNIFHRVVRKAKYTYQKPNSRLFIHHHDDLRKRYGLPPCNLKWGNDLIVPEIVKQSYSEIRDSTPVLDERYSLVDHWLKWLALIILLVGAILLMAQSYPWC